MIRSRTWCQQGMHGMSQWLSQVWAPPAHLHSCQSWTCNAWQGEAPQRHQLSRRPQECAPACVDRHAHQRQPAVRWQDALHIKAWTKPFSDADSHYTCCLLHAEQQIRIQCMMSAAAHLTQACIEAILAHQKRHQCMWRHNGSRRRA